MRVASGFRIPHNGSENAHEQEVWIRWYRKLDIDPWAVQETRNSVVGGEPVDFQFMGQTNAYNRVKFLLT